MSKLIERTRTLCATLAFFTLSMTCAGVGVAQTATVDVTGIVSADDGTPIAGASVVLSGSGRAQTARSDAQGRFSMPNVAGGTYAVHAVAPGYAPVSQQTVTIGSGNAQLTIVLSRATTNSLTVIGHVRASAGETVSTASAPSVILSAQDAAAAGVTAVSSMIWNQLATTPVIPLGGGSNATASFALRGPDPTETLVDIDGHQVNNGNTGDFDLSLLDPAALQDVQLVYGIAPSSLVGPNTIGGAINVQTLQPTLTPHALLRAFGGSYGSYGETVQATGSDARFGYAMSYHGASSNGSVNQSVLAPPDAGAPPARDETLQSVGSNSYGTSFLSKLRYQLGGDQGYGYLQLNFRDQAITKDDSALLTTFTPAGFTGGGGDDDAVPAEVKPFDLPPLGGYQSFAGTTLAAHQANYGFDAQLPLGNEKIDGAPATMLQLSHLTSLNSQSIAGPGEGAQPYLYNQRDLLGDDWLELDHRFPAGLLSFKYDLGTETLTTNYVQSQVTAELRHVPVGPDAFAPNDDDEGPPVSTLGLSQTSRSMVLRYNGDPTSQWHYSLAGYYSNYSTFGTSFDPRAGVVWTPSGNTAVRASIGTTFQTPQLSELVVLPPADRVPVGGIIYIGNASLQPDHATEYDVGFEQIFGRHGRQLHLSADVYQSNLRAPANQLNVEPIPHCQSDKHPNLMCPLSYPVNAGNGIYRGIDLRAEQQLGTDFRLRAGWSVDSSFLTAVPPEIQDGTLVLNEQTLGQPLHKAYFGFDRNVENGLVYGAQVNYEGSYNELNRTPYATLDAHVAYRRNGYEFGLYGTNLTNVYSTPFTIVGGGILYGTLPGQPMITTNAYTLQGSKVVFVFTRSI
ncbi:MAG: TonB-dependent receptor [Candidatus Tumulicola sp.]